MWSVVVLLPIALFAQLAGTCAPEVAPVTLVAMERAESGFDPLAIYDNTTHVGWRPRSRRKALWLAENLIAAGHRLDLGLMQIDSANLAGLHLTLSQAFDPCASLRVAARRGDGVDRRLHARLGGSGGRGGGSVRAAGAARRALPLQH